MLKFGIWNSPVYLFNLKKYYLFDKNIEKISPKMGALAMLF